MSDNIQNEAPRKIIHVDCDCFYAAIEMRDDPTLKNVPLAVGGASDRRGVISTCNYEARSYGVRSAMATAYAKKLCPDLVVIPPNMGKYKEASEKLHKIFQRYSENIEPLSLDEAFLDVSTADHCRGSATWMAQEIKQQAKEEIGITVSAGVAPNKLIAKVASDWNKPDGLFVVAPHEVEEFMEALPVSKIPGVGKVTTQKMKTLGIETCMDLQAWPKLELHNRFGSFGEALYKLSRGIDHRQVKSSRSRKSLSVEHTYPADLNKLNDCISELPRLYQDFAKRKEKSLGRYIIQKAFVKVKFNDFSTTTVERRADEPTLAAYESLCEEAWGRAKLPVRLLGVGVRLKDRYMNSDFKQLELFQA